MRQDTFVPFFVDAIEDVVSTYIIETAKSHISGSFNKNANVLLYWIEINKEMNKRNIIIKASTCN
jgi:Mlc titration factor MtfA (ptsG expression regulator)